MQVWHSGDAVHATHIPVWSRARNDFKPLAEPHQLSEREFLLIDVVGPTGRRPYSAKAEGGKDHSTRSRSRASGQKRSCNGAGDCASHQIDTPDGLKHAIEGRIQALANVHKLFVESRWTGADIHSLVQDELVAYSDDGKKRVHIDGPNALLEPSAAQAIAVTLHELATNAAKYGALSVPEGHVKIEWSRTSDGRLVLPLGWTGRPSRQAAHTSRLRHARDGRRDPRIAW